MNRYDIPIKKIEIDRFSHEKSELYENVGIIVTHFKNWYKVSDNIDIKIFYRAIEEKNIDTLDKLKRYIEEIVLSYKKKEIALNEAIIYKKTDNFRDLYKQIENILINYSAEFGCLKNFLNDIDKYMKDSTSEFTNNFFNVLNNDFVAFKELNYYKILMIIIILKTNSILKVLYKDNVPFRDDKYLLKFKTSDKKAIKPSLAYPPVKDYLILARDRLSELIGFNFNYNETNYKRDRNKIKNELLDEFIDLIVSDNYGKDKKYKKDMRITNKSKNFLDEHNQLIEMSLELTSTNPNALLVRKIGQ